MWRPLRQAIQSAPMAGFALLQCPLGLSQRIRSPLDDLLSPIMGPDTGTYSFNQAQEVLHTLPSARYPTCAGIKKFVEEKERGISR